MRNNKLIITIFNSILFLISLHVFAQTPCNQRVIENVDFTYTGTGTPARWDMSQINAGGFIFDQTAYAYVPTGNFSNQNINWQTANTNLNSTRQYAIVKNPKDLSAQYADLPTDGMIVINPKQGQDDQYGQYQIANLQPGNTYYVEIKIYNVISLSSRGPSNQCYSWCNWNNELNIKWEGNGNNAHDGQSAMTWTGSNGSASASGNWDGWGNQISNWMWVTPNGAYATMKGQMTLGNATTGFTFTFLKKDGSSTNPIVLGIDYIKIYGCQAEAINVSGGTTNVCEGSDLILTAQGLGSKGSSYTWYKNGVLLSGRNSDTLNIISAIGTGTSVTYEAKGEWTNKTVTLTSKMCCSSAGGTSDEVIRQSFNGLTYSCAAGRSGGYADIPDKGTKNFIDGAYIFAGSPCNSLNDGQYAVVLSSFAGDYWRTRPEVKDHTGVSGSGSLFVNAVGGVGQAFYKFNLDGLCNGTRYEFSAWYASLATGAETKPNIEFDVMNGATKVESVTTGVIPVNEKWYKADVTFVTPITGNPTYTLQLVNLVVGSSGNDVMIDDIVVKKCSPFINLYKDGTKDTAIAVCDNNPVNLKVSTYYDLPLAVTGSSSGTVYFQWMKASSSSGPWTLIGTPVTTGSYTAIPSATTTYYRVKVSSDYTRASNGQPPLASECGNDGMTTSFKLAKNGNFSIPPITGTTSYCENTTMTLTGNSGTGVKWEWRKGATYAAATVISGYGFNTDVAKKEFSKTFASGDEGNYYFVVQDATGCESYSTAAVTLIPTPVITGTLTACPGTTTALGATPTGGTWTSATTSVATVNSSTGVVTGVASGTSEITYTANGCSNKATVTVNSTPSISGTLTVCQNATTTLSGTPAGGTWSSATTSVATVNASTGVVTGVAGGTSVITYTANGCSTTSTVTVYATPAITGTLTVCPAATTNLSATPAGGTWSSATTSVATVNASTGVVTGVTDGTSVITYTANGCSNPATVTVNPTPAITGTLGVLVGATTTLTGNPAGGTWNSATQSVATINASGVVTGVAPGTSVITYSLNGCSITATVYVSTVGPMNPDETHDYCSGGSVTITGDGQNITSWAWYKQGDVAPVSGTSLAADKIKIVNDASDVIWIFRGFKDADYAEQRFTITVHPLPTITSPDSSRCGTGTVNLTAVPSAGIVKWYAAASGGSAIGTGSPWTTPSISTTTIYYAEVVDGTCISLSRSAATANVGKIPAVNAGLDVSVCFSNPNTTLTESGGEAIAWKWSNGLTTQTITVNPSATTDFIVTVTNADHCSASDTVQVKVTTNLTPAINGQDICSGDSITLTVSGGISWKWNTGETTNTLTVKPTIVTAYTVTADDGTGCTGTDDIIINVNSLPVAVINGTGVCSGKDAVLTASGADNGGHYLWDDGSTLNPRTVKPIVNTTYYVTAYNATGCSDSTSFVVQVSNNPVPHITADKQRICSGTSAVLTAAAPDGTAYSWSNFAITDIITVNPPASTLFTVTVTNAALCTATDTLTIQVIQPPDNPLVNDVERCSNDPVIDITLTIPNPKTGYVYRWFSDATGNTLLAQGISYTEQQVNAAHTYYIETISPDSCHSPMREAVNINWNQPPTASFYYEPAGVILQNSKVMLVNQSVNATKYYWNFGDKGTSDQKDPIKIYSDTGFFTIMLTAISGQNCRAKDSLTIYVKKRLKLWLPDVFTPNNDGRNDMFFVRGPVKVMKLEIYNQWGYLVFKSDKQTDGWDGKYKGVDQSEGGYVWRLEAITTDEQTIEESGLVTIIR